MKRTVILSLAIWIGNGLLFGSTFYGVDPLSSFVLADTGTGEYGYLPDTPDSPLWLAVQPNTTITIMAVGGICYAGTDPNGTPDSPCYAIGGGHNLSAAETQAEIGAVFSSSYALLPDTEPQRIPGAVASGQPDYTDPYYTTFYFDRNTSTVNPYDFLVPYGVGITLTVPANADYLVLGVFDSYYADNTDPSNTLGVIITGFSAPVPEPATAGLMLAALGGMLALRRVISRRS